MYQRGRYLIGGFTSFIGVTLGSKTAFVVLSNSVLLLGRDLVVACPSVPVWNSIHGLGGPQPALVPHATAV